VDSFSSFSFCYPRLGRDHEWTFVKLSVVIEITNVRQLSPKAEGRAEDIFINKGRSAKKADCGQNKHAIITIRLQTLDLDFSGFFIANGFKVILNAGFSQLAFPIILSFD